MTITDKKLVARFFFRNCSVSIHLPGEIKISRSIMPGKEDVILPRDFHPAGETSEFLGMQSDFYKFLAGTSPSTAEFIKKIAAIGYMLCNKLPRGGRRCRAFCCINAEERACANGKSLFAQAVAQMCNATLIDGHYMNHIFWLNCVSSATNLLVIDDVSRDTNLQRLFGNILNFSTDNFGFVVDDCAVDPDTIGQFSELFDRTGKNIFEGDILQCSSVPNILLEVRYNTLQGAFCLVEHTHTEGALLGTCPLGEMLRHYPDMSIIGNRFDNPSLISDKQ